MTYRDERDCMSAPPGTRHSASGDLPRRALGCKSRSDCDLLFYSHTINVLEY